MAFALYLVPWIGTGSTATNDPFRAKYFNFQDAVLTTPVTYGVNRYGAEGWVLVGADTSATDDTMLKAQSDVTAIPVNLDAFLTGGQVTVTQTKLEAANIPAGWVNTGLTWRQVVRIVLGMFKLLQRFKSLNGQTKLFGGAITLNSTISDIPSTPRGNLTAAATSLGFSVDSITLGMTIRAALKNLADQAGGLTFWINGVSI